MDRAKQRKLDSLIPCRAADRWRAIGAPKLAKMVKYRGNNHQPRHGSQTPNLHSQSWGGWVLLKTGVLKEPQIELCQQWLEMRPQPNKRTKQLRNHHQATYLLFNSKYYFHLSLIVSPTTFKQNLGPPPSQTTQTNPGVSYSFIFSVFITHWVHLLSQPQLVLKLSRKETIDADISKCHGTHTARGNKVVNNVKGTLGASVGQCFFFGCVLRRARNLGYLFLAVGLGCCSQH